MPALQRLRCDEEAGPSVAWEYAADGGEQSAVGGFQLGPGGLPLEDDELMAQHQDLQVLGGVTSSKQREELDGAAKREVDESGQHVNSLRGGCGELAGRYRNQHPNPQLTRHVTVSAPYARSGSTPPRRPAWPSSTHPAATASRSAPESGRPAASSIPRRCSAPTPGWLTSKP